MVPKMKYNTHKKGIRLVNDSRMMRTIILNCLFKTQIENINRKLQMKIARQRMFLCMFVLNLSLICILIQ